MKNTMLLLATTAAILATRLGHAEDTRTYVNSDPAAYAAMQKLPADEPIHMLNLIRFRDEAAYPEDNEFAAKGWTGEEAYAEYGRRSTPIARSVGAQPIYGGLPQLVIIGPESERWDAVFVMAYPNAQAFNAFLNDPEYRKHAFHRSAAIEDSRLIRLAPMPIAPQPAPPSERARPEG